MLDLWQEILFTVSKNKLRTFLTAFSVAWGIFMLIILLGFGTGFQRGVEWQFRDQATNAIFVNPGQTSMPYEGMQPGRRIRLHNSDLPLLTNSIPEIDHLAANFYCYGEFTIRYKDNYSSFTVNGIYPDLEYIENQTPIKGRYINEIDIRDRRKVAVIGSEVVTGLFENEDPVGKYIDVRGIQYKVVGIFDDKGGQGDLKKIYIPFSTAQLAYSGTDNVHWITYTIGDASVEESNAIVHKTKELLGQKYKFATEDSRALRVWNSVEEYQKFQNLFFWIKTFLFVVGVFTIIAGIVGVSNIMLIAVKERTREIGIRKALGATPSSIVNLFVLEAIFITVIAGYFGLLAGVGIIELIRRALVEFNAAPEFFRDPETQIWVALGATGLLVISGTLAGFFPARRAAKVEPIVALRDE